jgi:hypothetical protein
MYIVLILVVLGLAFFFGIGIIHAVYLGFRLSRGEERWSHGEADPLLNTLGEVLLSDLVRFPARSYATALRIDMSLMVLRRLCQRTKVPCDWGALPALYRDIADHTIVQEMKGYLDAPDETQHLTHFQQGQLGEHQKNLSAPSRASELWEQADAEKIAALQADRKERLSGLLEALGERGAGAAAESAASEGFPVEVFKRRVFGALRLEVGILEEVANDPSSLNQSLIVVGVAAVAGALFSGLASLSLGLTIHVLLMAALTWACQAAATYLLALRVIPDAAAAPAENMDFPSYLRAMGFTWVPGPLLVLLTVPPLWVVVYLAFIGWVVALTTVLIRRAFGASTMQAALIAFFGLGAGSFVAALVLMPVTMLLNLM